MNKKLFFGLAATFAVAIAVVCTTLALNNSSSPTDLLSKNLEALSRYEIDPVVITCSQYPGENGYCWETTGTWAFDPERGYVVDICKMSSTNKSCTGIPE